ncbi:MAG TPA: hypothetical protein VHO95_12130, partial [Candidatus Dormibacteraeota bacterium]|nr:hypothetical protein [Candidatus Dormibacteraeota bacterium]
MSPPPEARLRALVHIDRIGSQYAAYWALMAQGSLPLPEMSQLLIEVSPSNLVFPVGDAAFKACPVQSAGTLVERDFGLLELHANRSDTVLEARDAALRVLGLQVTDRQVPEVVSTQRISALDAYHSHLFNKVRRGAWTLPGDTLFIVEVAPAGYAYLIANEIEKATGMELVRVAGTGLFGRLITAGT